MEYVERLYHTDLGGVNIGERMLCCCGKRSAAKSHSFGPAARDNWWLIYLKEGCGEYTIGDRSFQIGKGDLFCAFPMKKISYRAAPGSIWTIYWVSLATEPLSNLVPLMNIAEESPVVHIETPSVVENIFETLLLEIPLETMQSKFRCASLVYKLLAAITPSVLRAPARDYIDEAIYIMTNSCDEPLGCSQLAAKLNLSSSYFSRLFKQKCGLTPGKWLLNYRLDKASALICETEMKIKEIALSVGFSDPLYFSRRFRERFGASPAKWREKQK